MKILVLGATSTIARALVLQLATPADEFLLAARNVAEAESIAADLSIRIGCKAVARALEATSCDTHAAWMQEAIAQLGGLHGVIVAFGELGPRASEAYSWPATQSVIEINFSAAVALLEPAAAVLEEQGSGYILALSSVAGVRGRRSNYLYGATKAALTTYLEGLAHRLAPCGVQVKTALLGFVDSAMTEGMPMAAPLRSSPERAAKGILRLLHSGAQRAFIPWFWRPIMLIIRLLPTRIFHKTNL